MQLRSMGLRSDLAMIDGSISDRGDYLVVRSPDEPQYYWGNLLVFPEPPKIGDLSVWRQQFVEAFSEDPEVRHQTFTWDLTSEVVNVSEFIAAGFRLEKTVVLTAQTVHAPKKRNDKLLIRPLVGDSDWEALTVCQLACRDPDMPENDYEGFVKKRLQAARLRVEAGQGEWYGGFIDESMVASLGIFRMDTLARFQVVVTIPEARRQGYCGTLVYEIAKKALARPGTDTLVMLADEDYHAARIYESVGFLPKEQLQGLCRWPEKTA